MSSLRAAVDWLLRQGFAWKAAEAASIADLPEDRAKAYLRRLVVDQVVVLSADGLWYQGGPREAVAQWRREARRPNGEGGNSAAYRRARAAREAVLARANGGQTPPSLTWQEPPPAVITRQEATMDTPAGTVTTVEATAMLLGVSVRTVERLISRGEIRAFKVGRLVRIPMSEVNRIIGQATEATRTP